MTNAAGAPRNVAQTSTAAVIGSKTLSAHTEQSAARPVSGNVAIPQGFWTVIILGAILCVLLVCKMIDEMGQESGGGGNGSNSLPAF